jgi:ribosomal protein S19
MAIRFDASGDSLSRARLAGAKTVMAWVYITTDRNDYTVFFGLGSNELIGTGGDGTTLLHYDGTMERTGSNLSTGTWFHLAYVSNGDALANGFTVYLNGAADITYTVRSLTSAGTNMYLGNDEYSEWLNGRMAHVKIWNVALTAAEIQQEMYSSRPQRFANLWSWLPMIESGSGRNSEWSSSGNTWTANGTLADEDGPPVAWNLTGWQLPFVTSGGAAGQTLLPARIESTATVYSPTLQPGAVTIQPARIESTAIVYEPTVSQTGAAQTLLPELIGSTATVYEPVIVPGVVVVLPARIESTATVYNPTLQPGVVVVLPARIESTATVYEPVVAVGGMVVTITRIESTVTVYEPTISQTGPAQTLLPELIGSTATVYEPVIVPGGVVPGGTVVARSFLLHGLRAQRPSTFPPASKVQR